MLVPVLTAAISALAALAGAYLNNLMALRRVDSESREQERQADRREYLRIAAEITEKSWDIRQAGLSGIRRNRYPENRSDLLQSLSKLDSLVSQLQLLAIRFDTVYHAQRYSVTLRKIVDLLAGSSDEEMAKSHLDQATLLLASAKMEELALVAEFRKECNIGELTGQPEFNFDRDMRAFLRYTLKDETAVDEVMESIGKIPQKEEIRWRL